MSIREVKRLGLTGSQQLGGSGDLHPICVASSDIGLPICLFIFLFMRSYLGRGLYRLALDGQLLRLALDQEPNNNGMSGYITCKQLPPSCTNPDNNHSNANGSTDNRSGRLLRSIRVV